MSVGFTAVALAAAFVYAAGTLALLRVLPELEAGPARQSR
jgi:hypothetical protein